LAIASWDTAVGFDACFAAFESVVTGLLAVANVALS
jgi:hypothetical protein